MSTSRLAMRSVFKASIMLLAALGVLLVALRQAAPWPVPEEVDAALVVAAASTLKSWKQERIFVGFNGSDPSPERLAQLRKGLPSKAILPMGQRPSNNDRCGPVLSGNFAVGACMQDDFLEIHLQAVPLWGVALVSGRTAACGMEWVVVRPMGTWHIVSSRGLCA